MNTKEKDYFSLAEIAELLGVCKETVRKRTSKGELKSVLKFGKIYVSKESLKEYMEKKD